MLVVDNWAAVFLITNTFYLHCQLILIIFNNFFIIVCFLFELSYMKNYTLNQKLYDHKFNKSNNNVACNIVLSNI